MIGTQTTARIGRLALAIAILLLMVLPGIAAAAHPRLSRCHSAPHRLCTRGDCHGTRDRLLYRVA